MKKRIAASIVTLLVVLFFCACSGNTSEPIVGEWKLVRVEWGDFEYSPEEYSKVCRQDYTDVCFEISGNGKVVLTLPGNMGSGSWEKGDDGEYTVVGAAQAMQFIYDENSDEVIWLMGEDKLFFERQN